MTSVPILSVEQCKEFETDLFGGEEAKEWAAMSRAGVEIARAVLEDFRELGGFPSEGRILVVAGKGHNGADAMLAAQAILAQFPLATAELLLVFGERALRPLAARAYQNLVHGAGGRVRLCGTTLRAKPAAAYALSLDGVFGFQFRPPVDSRVEAIFDELGELPVGLRAAVDLPSGLGSSKPLRADFTYATGIVKASLVVAAHREAVGRLRYLDLAFFSGPTRIPPSSDRVMTKAILAPLGALRAAVSDKRTFGHLFVVSGSRSFPGAVLMSALAALRTGVGLLTVFVPESLAPAYAARVPEAMWVGWPETPAGGLALEGLHLFQERVSRASAVLIGSGLSREAEVLALASEIVKSLTVPVVIDADALQPEVVRANGGPRVLTPHAGEFARLAGTATLRDFAKASGAITVLKSSLTQVSDGESVYHCLQGGPVLARGGSGDILAGMIGGLLAQTPADPLLAACRGVLWHGLAADALAQTFGSTAVQTTQLMDFFSQALRSASSLPGAKRESS